MGCVLALSQFSLSLFSLVLVIILCSAGGSVIDSESKIEATDDSISIKVASWGLYFHHETPVGNLEVMNRDKVQGHPG